MADDGPSSGANRRSGSVRPATAGPGGLSRRHWLAIGLVVATGSIHLYVGWARARPALALAGVGFFVGLALFLAGDGRRWLYSIGIAYVVVQIVLWAVFNAGEYTAIGYADKAIQVVLVGMLASLLRGEPG